MIIVNPNAGGGTAIQKWRRISPRFNSEDIRVHIIDGGSSTRAHVADALLRREKIFIAAGGDGTLNGLLNTLMTLASHEDRSRIRLGAIGLGSSNDFHKPFRGESMIGNIPAALKTSSATLRDIGCMSFRAGDKIMTRYFLINASAGLVADANRFFNAPDQVLRILKRGSTAGAILYAAAKTIFRYANLDAEISDEMNGSQPVRLTHLGILKNLHFSGSMRWSGNSEYHNGLFDVRLCTGMNVKDRFRLLRGCSAGAVESWPGIRSWKCRSLSISASKAFSVECDGEVFQTTLAHFTILPRHLWVCES